MMSTGPRNSLTMTHVTSATPVPILIPQYQHMRCKSRPTISRIRKVMTTPSVFTGPTEVCGDIVTVALLINDQELFFCAKSFL